MNPDGRYFSKTDSLPKGIVYSVRFKNKSLNFSNKLLLIIYIKHVIPWLFCKFKSDSRIILFKFSLLISSIFVSEFNKICNGISPLIFDTLNLI